MYILYKYLNWVMGGDMKRLLLAVLLVLIFPNMAFAKDLQAGDAPPDYLGTDIKGNKLNIADYKGKVVIISFWASWCAPCRKELPILDAIQKEVSEDHLKVIAINYGEKRSLLKKLAKDVEDLSVAVTYDGRKAIAKRYKVKAIPNMFMIGRDGKIAHHHVGYGEGMLPQIVNELNALLQVPYEVEDVAVTDGD